jgi:broad specificity phosphatase PhoE
MGVRVESRPSRSGERVDRGIARARQCDGSVALFSRWHLLRVLVARWIGLSPTDGQHFLLGTGTLGVLGYYRDVSAVKIWNGAIAV